MIWAAILAAALLALPMRPGRDAADRVSWSEPAQAASTQGENPQPPPVDPARTGGDEKPSAGKVEELPPPDTKTKEPSAPKGLGGPPVHMTKRRVRSKRTAPPQTDGEPRKIVVHRGGVSEPVTQILPGISQEEADRQRESAEQLLAAADSSLKELGTRSLSVRRQQTVAQIRQYVDLARAALKESDTQRAHTLAMKAYLLSDDLVKH